jgi:hypothetical protein
MLVSYSATCFLMDRGITRGTRRIALRVSPFLGTTFADLELLGIPKSVFCDSWVVGTCQPLRNGSRIGPLRSRYACSQGDTPFYRFSAQNSTLDHKPCYFAPETRLARKRDS